MLLFLGASGVRVLGSLGRTLKWLRQQMDQGVLERVQRINMIASVDRGEARQVSTATDCRQTIGGA